MHPIRRPHLWMALLMVLPWRAIIPQPWPPWQSQNNASFLKAFPTNSLSHPEIVKNPLAYLFELFRRSIITPEFLMLASGVGHLSRHRKMSSLLHPPPVVIFLRLGTRRESEQSHLQLYSIYSSPRRRVSIHTVTENLRTSTRCLRQA